ncbi:MAG: hypothetical protein ABUS48_04835 [Pseudomonadota bacterium]
MTLALASLWAGAAGILWAGEDAAFAEDGAPYPAGLTQYGLDPARLIVVRARKREEALWAAEQGLAVPGAVVLCALGAHRKPLELKATRRLLLAGERNGSRCLLLKPEDAPTAAWTRWRVETALSQGEGRELGPPTFRATLSRHRAGAAGQSYFLEWNAHDRAFRDMGRDLAAASGERSANPIRQSA